LFCQHVSCAPEDFEQQLFAYALHWHVRPLARLLAKLDPGFFEEDFGFICDVATATSHSEVLTELNRFFGRNVRDPNWARRTFLLRMSGKRVLRLSRKLFSADVAESV
jgi:hypothetical protein